MTVLEKLFLSCFHYLNGVECNNIVHRYISVVCLHCHLSIGSYDTWSIDKK